MFKGIFEGQTLLMFHVPAIYEQSIGHRRLSGILLHFLTACYLRMHQADYSLRDLLVFRGVDIWTMFASVFREWTAKNHLLVRVSTHAVWRDRLVQHIGLLNIMHAWRGLTRHKGTYNLLLGYKISIQRCRKSVGWQIDLLACWQLLARFLNLISIDLSLKICINVSAPHLSLWYKLFWILLDLKWNWVVLLRV